MRAAAAIPAALRQRGFTLTELMVGVAIMGILGAVAAPGFTQLIDKQRVKGVSGDLFTALLHARSEAVRRNIQVTLAPATAGAWQDGWNVPDPTNTAVFFLRHEAVPKTVISGPASVVYLGNGRIMNAAGAAAPSFQITGADQSIRRCIRLDLAGRPTIIDGAC